MIKRCILFAIVCFLTVFFINLFDDYNNNLLLRVPDLGNTREAILMLKDTPWKVLRDTLGYISFIALLFSFALSGVEQIKITKQHKK